MEFLYLVNGSNGNCGVCGQCEAVLVGLRVERTHVLHLLEVHVTEHQLLVAAVDHGGPVATREHVANGSCSELPQNCRLGPENNLECVEVRLLFQQ